MTFFLALYTILHLESQLSIKKNRFADLKHVFKGILHASLYSLPLHTLNAF